MTAALDLMREVAAAGGRLRVVGDGSLQVSAPAPLPDALVENLRAHKQTLLAALGPVVPTEWTAGVARLRTMECPTLVHPDRWRLAGLDARRFLRRWGSKASALGWETIDVFGADPVRPVERIDRAGLIILLHGDEVVAITNATARMRTSTGAVMTFYRRPQPGAVPLWELGR